jgi:hypothetical protein
MFFTTNVDASSGVVASTGFTASNTYEIQVLDGFSFSQNTTADVVTLNEAGATPVRGQRSFNTALDPVDFSFSTYIRPADSSLTAGGFNTPILTIPAPTAMTVSSATTTVAFSVKDSTGAVTSPTAKVITFGLSRAGTTGANSTLASHLMIASGPTVVTKAVTTGALPATMPTLTTSVLNIGTPTYQWSVQAGSTGSFTNITGATSSTYQLNSLSTEYTAGVATGASTNTYRCTVTGTINGVAASTVSDEIIVPVVQTVATGAGAIVVATSSLNKSLKAANGTAFTDIDFTTGSTNVTVYEGANTVPFDGIGTTASTNSTFKVTITPNLTIVTITPTAITSNTATNAIAFSVQNSAGTVTTPTTKTINYTLSRAGTSGTSGSPSTSASYFTITNPVTVVTKVVTTGALPATMPTLTTNVVNITTPTYQWSIQAGSTGSFTNITGATSSSYVLNSGGTEYTAGVGTGASTNTYRCTVTGTINGVAASTVSDEITVPVVQTVATGVGAIVVATSSLNRSLKAATGAAFTDVDYTTGGVDIKVYEGANLLNFDGIGSASTNSTFKITSTPTSVTVVNTGSVFTVNTGTSVVTAEESVLWNALMSTASVGSTSAGWTETYQYAKLVADYSQVHQLQKFGVIIVLDSSSFIIDNCALDSATVDFGLDAIATIAWAGKGTKLRQLPGLTATAGTTVTFGTGLSGTAKGKNYVAPYIANKLSTLSVKGGINGSGTVYTVALTGGQMVISNNITYLTPANLGIVNQPITYFTGTRSVTGTLNAYLRTGTVAVPNSTATLLSDMLTQSLTDVNPAYEMIVSVGGASNPIRIELDVSAAVLTIPSIATEQVISTSINFTGQGYTTGNAFDISQSNEIEVRYYTVV